MIAISRSGSVGELPDRDDRATDGGVIAGAAACRLLKKANNAAERSRTRDPQAGRLRVRRRQSDGRLALGGEVDRAMRMRGFPRITQAVGGNSVPCAGVVQAWRLAALRSIP